MSFPFCNFMSPEVQLPGRTEGGLKVPVACQDVCSVPDADMYMHLAFCPVCVHPVHTHITALHWTVNISMPANTSHLMSAETETITVSPLPHPTSSDTPRMHVLPFPRSGLGPSLSSKRKLLEGKLRGLGFEVLPGHGAYFLVADVSRFLREGEDDASFCMRLTREGGVTLIPVSALLCCCASASLLCVTLFGVRACRGDPRLWLGMPGLRGTQACARRA